MGTLSGMYSRSLHPIIAYIVVFCKCFSCYTYLVVFVYSVIPNATMTIVTAPNHVMLNFTSRAVDRQVNDAIISNSMSLCSSLQDITITVDPK